MTLLGVLLTQLFTPLFICVAAAQEQAAGVSVQAETTKESSSSIASPAPQASPTIESGGGDLDEIKAAASPSEASPPAGSTTMPSSAAKESPALESHASSVASEAAAPLATTTSSSSASSVGQPPMPSADKPAYIKLLELQLDIAERAHAMTPSAVTLAELVNSFEQIISAQCYESLRETLRYDGYPSDEECRTKIKRVLELDGTSSIANCAQFGVDSSQCRQASSLLDSGSFTIDSGIWRSTDGSQSGRVETVSLREAIRQKKSSKQFTEQSEKIYQASLAARANPRDFSLAVKVESLARPLLQEMCISPRLALMPLSQPTPTPSYGDLIDGPNGAPLQRDDVSSDGASDSTGNDPFSELIKSLDSQPGKRPVPTPTPVVFEGPNFRRYRLVTDECDRIIQTVAQANPSSAVVQCFRFGPVSVPCIQARRITASSPRETTATGAKPAQLRNFSEAGGFESF